MRHPGLAVVALSLIATSLNAHPLPRGEDPAPVRLDGGFALGDWVTEEAGTGLAAPASSRNFLIPQWGDATPTRLRARIDPASGADLALLFRARAEPQPQGPPQVFGYGLSVNTRKGRIDFLRFDGARVADPGVLVKNPALKTTSALEVLLLMSGPLFTAFVYDATSREQLASLAWSDGTYAEGGPGLYSHRRTPPEVRVRVHVGSGGLAPAAQSDLAAEWLIRLPRASVIPDAVRATLRPLKGGSRDEQLFLGREPTVAALRAAGLDVQAHPHVPYKFRDRTFERRHTRQIRRTRAGIRFIDGLKDPALIERHLQKYAERFPQLTRLESIGKSHEGRDVWALSIGRNLDDPDRPALLLCAAHHANEVSTPEFVLDAVRYLLENRRRPEVARWLKRFRIVAVPMVNPDGSHAFWHVGEHLGRTNRRPDDEAERLGLSDYGVDLNRNYPFGWANVEDRFNSGQVRSRFYRGPSAGSEPEVRAMMDLAGRVRFFAMVSFHGAATKILVPYTIDGATDPVQSPAWPVAEEMIEALPHKFGGRTYEAVRNLYPVGGVDQDWYFHTYGTLAFLIEVPANVPTRRKPLDAMLEHTRPAWQTLLRRYDRGPALALKVEDAEGDPIAAEVELVELGLRSAERWSTHPRTGRFYSLLPTGGTWTIRVTAGDERTERRVRIAPGGPTDVVVRFTREAD